MTPARVATSAALAACVLMGAFQWLGAATMSEAAPFGLVSLQLAAAPVDAQTIVDGWVGAARTAAIRAHAVDLVLPFAYGTALLAAGRALATGRAAGTPSARWARRAGVAGVAAAAFDQVENVAMGLTLLDGATSGRTLVTVAAAAAKWGLLAVAVGALATIRWRCRSSVGSGQPTRSR